MPTVQLVITLEGIEADLGGALQLLACTRAARERESFSIYSAQRPTDLALEGPWQYFIRIPSMSPAIPAPAPLRGVGWPAVFAVNGLVLLHHPDPGRPIDPPRSSIGIVHRVMHKTTGETLSHDDYDGFFRKLKRTLQAAGARTAA
jgi:hypothetical protein